MMVFRLGVLLCAWATLAAAAQSSATGTTTPPAAAPDISTLNYHLRPRQVAPDTWVIEGAVDDFSRANGCNITNTAFIATEQGVLVINTGPSKRYGEQQRAAIERITRAPVLRVLNLNLHPDYFFGNQAWSDRPTQALAGSIAGMKAEGANYANNLYRLCGDWMKGTESTPAQEAVVPHRFTLGNHRLELRRFEGHTGDDLVLLDHSTGVVFAGGLVFSERVPTMPHAQPARWQASLNQLQEITQNLPLRVLIPSHGAPSFDARGITQTRDWLTWLEQTLRTSAQQGLDLGEVLRLPIPARFASWAALDAEYQRNVTTLYPAFERAVLGAMPLQ